MKISTVFAAVAAVVFGASWGVMSAQAQNDPRPPQAQAQTQPPTPPPAAAPAPAAQPPAPPAGDAVKPAADTPPLTKEESDRALTILQTCSGACHGTERFEGKGYDKAGWQQVMDSMGYNAGLPKADADLAVRYLVINLPPPPKP